MGAGFAVALPCALYRCREAKAPSTGPPPRSAPSKPSSPVLRQANFRGFGGLRTAMRWIFRDKDDKVWILQTSVEKKRLGEALTCSNHSLLLFFFFIFVCSIFLHFFLPDSSVPMSGGSAWAQRDIGPTLRRFFGAFYNGHLKGDTLELSKLNSKHLFYLCFILFSL